MRSPGQGGRRSIVDWSIVAERTSEHGPPLFGRARELAVLRDRLRAAIEGRGGLVLVGGTAGSGKTALASALVREAAARGCLALVGHCYDLTETPPYEPWTELFGGYLAHADLPPLPASLTGESGLTDGPAMAAASRAALFRQVRELLQAIARREPLVLVLDDLHWSDPASLELLRAVARQAAALPLLIVGCYRDDELPAWAPLARALPLLIREAEPTRLELRPLDDAAVGALVAARYALPAAPAARLVQYLAARAAGNPFFLGELLRDLEEDGRLRQADGAWQLRDLADAGVPRLLRQVIDGRVARLGASAERLLAWAAIVGHDVPLATWAAVGGVDESCLIELVEPAVEAHLLEATPDGTAVRFAHSLIRQALYEAVLPPVRRLRHRAVAEALSGTPGAEPDAVAYHFQQAGDPRAAEWLIRAAERAELGYAHQTAADRYRAALAIRAAAGAREGELGWLELRHGLQYRLSEPGRGLAEVERAAQHAALADDRLLAALARFAAGYLRGHLGAEDGVVDEMEAGLTALQRLGPAARRRLADLPAGQAATIARHGWGILARWLAHRGYFPAAERAARQAVPTTGTAGDDQLGRAWACAWLGRVDEARCAFGLARARYEADGDDAMRGWAAITELRWGALPYAADRPADCRALAEDAARSFASSGEPPWIEPRHAFLPVLLLGAGDSWSEARRLAEAGLELARRLGLRSPWHGLHAAGLGRVAYEQGDRELAAAMVRVGLPTGLATRPGGQPFGDAIVLQRLAAAVAIGNGDLTTARAWLEAHDHWLAWSGAVLGQADGQLAWAAYACAAGDSPAAYRHAMTALALAEAPRQPLVLLASHRLLGELETARGRPAMAAPHLESALALADACAAPYERALTLLALAEARLAAGSRSDAQATAAAAQAICAALGAGPALARAERLLATPAGSDARASAGLTAREREVLALVASGRTNLEIADALVISVATVRRHTINIYGKLGLRNRAQATAYAIEHGLTGPAPS